MPGTPEMMLAQSALWVGLLYDDAALAAAEALVRGAGWEACRGMRAAVPRAGCCEAALARRHAARPGAADVVAIARDGLRARARLDACGP